jgi:PII-like signaling protein
VTTDSLKLTAYFGERQRVGGRLVADALLDIYGRHEIATSVLLRGFEGYGLRHHLRTDNSLSLSEDLPAVAVAVDERSRIEEVVDAASKVLASGLVTLERARMQTDGFDAPDADAATKLTVYLGRQERVGRTPAFVAICDLLHRRSVAGASVLLGVDGTAHGERQRAAFFSRNSDVPVMIIAVASGAEIAAVLPDLVQVLRRPLVTFERLLVCKRDGVSLAPPLLPDGAGADVWQKLMIYTSEAQLHDGRPIHRELTRRLRRSGAAGVTTLRGVWGFHGAHEPHGDRLWQLGRHVPTITVCIDRPDRIAGVFPIIDELTAEHGLVTSELVPTARRVHA